MLTLRAAATLLAAVHDQPSLAALAAAVACDGEAAPLDGQACEALGIGPEFGTAHVATGPGTLRALLLEWRGGAPIRDALARLAARLSSRAPHLLWLAVVRGQDGNEAAIAAWDAGRSPPRVSALVYDSARVLDSDAETLCALAAARAPVDLLTHAHWLDVLGRDALTRRFYRTLEGLVRSLAEKAVGRAGEEDRNAIALLYLSRMLFLSFLEAKGWLDGDRAFLSHRFDACVAERGGFQQRVLLPLFFGTLNTPLRRRARAATALGRIPFLNGGLFARASVERRHAALRFGDESFGDVFGELLGRYRFTAREETTSWSEAAIDPEMLGKAFESLMVSRQRRESGAFFTPQPLVEQVTDSALRAVLAQALPPDTIDAVFGSRALDRETREWVRRRLASIRILDPACGSGAFLVYALERLSALLIALGDERPVPDVRRDLLTSSIFGVDLNPTAVWLCELRLWLSMIIESDVRDPARVAPLPNLDHHVRVGDSLTGGDLGFAIGGDRAPARISRLRTAYARAVGARKRTLARALDREERAHALAACDAQLVRLGSVRRDLLAVLRGRTLFGDRIVPAQGERQRVEETRIKARELRAARRAIAGGGALPFSYATHFPDAALEGGFDVVLGNPPWVRLHRIPVAAREKLRREFTVYRDAAWRAGAIGARAAAGFASQVDLAALFVERSLTLVRDSGAVALLVPAKLFRSLAGGGLRRLIATHHTLLAVDDWSDAPATFDAAVYPAAVLVRRGQTAGDRTALAVTVHTRSAVATWTAGRTSLALTDDDASPWLLLPPTVRTAFDRLAAAGVPMSTTKFAPPILGVKCGCNDAFIVQQLAREGAVTSVQSDGRNGYVETALLRPVLRGESVARWTVPTANEALIWTHGGDGLPVRSLPPHAERWLHPWRRRLAARTDARGRSRWWSLFRTEGAACDVARVVWADLALAPRAAVLPPGDRTVPLNTCYVARCADPIDALAFAALLNSPLAAAWLHQIAEPARGRYRRFLGWSMALLPVPANWPLAREILAPLGKRAVEGTPPSSAELLQATLRAYRLRLGSVAALLEWHAR